MHELIDGMERSFDKTTILPRILLELSSSDTRIGCRHFITAQQRKLDSITNNRKFVIELRCLLSADPKRHFTTLNLTEFATDVFHSQ